MEENRMEMEQKVDPAEILADAAERVGGDLDVTKMKSAVKTVDLSLADGMILVSGAVVTAYVVGGAIKRGWKAYKNHKKKKVKVEVVDKDGKTIKTETAKSAEEEAKNAADSEPNVEKKSEEKKESEE